MQTIKSKIILLALAVLLAVGVTLMVQKSTSNLPADTASIQADSDFGHQHYVWMNLDTFTHLIQKAYHPYVATNVNNDLLVVRIKDANTLAQDFYNGNEALLELKIQKHQFEISSDTYNNMVIGRFKIKNNMVAVPNDVLIKAVDKTTN